MEYEIWFDNERIRSFDFAEAKRWALERAFTNYYPEYNTIKISLPRYHKVMFVVKHGEETPLKWREEINSLCAI